MKEKPKLTKKRGNYYVVALNGTTVGYTERSRNAFNESGFAGWDFRPNEMGEKLGLAAKWSPTPKRAVEASLRARETSGG